LEVKPEEFDDFQRGNSARTYPQQKGTRKLFEREKEMTAGEKDWKIIFSIQKLGTRREKEASYIKITSSIKKSPFWGSFNGFQGES